MKINKKKMYEETQKEIVIGQLKELLNIQVSLTNRKMIEMFAKPGMSSAKSRWNRITKKVGKISANKARSPTAQSIMLKIQPSK